ncbi:MAG: hypothetical protein Q9223_007137 [Gallowayella weberi]
MLPNPELHLPVYQLPSQGLNSRWAGTAAVVATIKAGATAYHSASNANIDIATIAPRSPTVGEYHDHSLTFSADTFPDIGRQKYNIRVRSAWEADEAFDFERFHIPGCKRDRCDGKCGLKNEKELVYQKKLREDKEKQRQSIDKRDEAQRRKSTISVSSEPIEDVEEPGDTDFATGAKVNSKAGKEKSRKKNRVTFAIKDAIMFDESSRPRKRQR